jgi:hypothetical protein
MLRINLEQIKIRDLIKQKILSVWTGHSCLSAGLGLMAEIIEDYESGESFLRLRNVGRLTCNELENICKEYLANIDVILSSNFTGNIIIYPCFGIWNRI